MTVLLTVASPLLTEVGATPLTPAQRAALWELAAVLDERRIPIPSDPSHGDAVWVRVSSQRLRGTWGRDDNVWLRRMLDRLLGVRLGGRAGTDAWGGVVLAQYRITDGGRVVDLLLPPAGLSALRSPATFAKIDAEAAHRLPPHARTLYGLLADKNRQQVRKWRVEVDDLKTRLGVHDRYSNRFNDFRRWVLDPAVKAINDFGVLVVRWSGERLGRQVHVVIFLWDLANSAQACQVNAQSDADAVEERQLTLRSSERQAKDWVTSWRNLKGFAIEMQQKYSRQQGETVDRWHLRMWDGEGQPAPIPTQASAPVPLHDKRRVVR